MTNIETIHNQQEKTHFKPELLAKTAGTEGNGSHEPSCPSGNPHKGMIMMALWVTRGEKASLQASVAILKRDATSQENGYAMSNITEIIQDAMERGDLK